MEDYKPSIKFWALEDRPREKLLKKGIGSLSDAELIALLIGSGIRNESAVEISKKILSATGNNLNELAKLTINDLRRIKGIGEARSISIVAALELGRRRKMEEVIQRGKIGGSRDVFDLFQPLLGDLPHEEFWVLLLNRSNFILDKTRISQGGIAGTVTDIRLIMKQAIDKLAVSIILCHNHPSGNLKPSEADTRITKKLKESGEILDINVLDHLIVSDSSYFSFADEGLMQ
jgi:DNA repair protein RadC